MAKHNKEAKEEKAKGGPVQKRKISKKKTKKCEGAPLAPVDVKGSLVPLPPPSTPSPHTRPSHASLRECATTTIGKNATDFHSFLLSPPSSSNV